MHCGENIFCSEFVFASVAGAANDVADAARRCHARLPACPSVCLSARLSVCLPVCRPLTFINTSLYRTHLLLSEARQLDPVEFNLFLKCTLIAACGWSDAP